MLGGDLSNDAPRRVLVTLDAISRCRDGRAETRALRWRRFDKAAAFYELDRQSINQLYVNMHRWLVRFELVVFDRPDEFRTAIEELLDERGCDVFAWSTGYLSPQALVADLPYRPEVVGVVDANERVMRYGSYSMSMR